MPFRWDDDAVEMLKRMWADGATAREVAAELHCGRNAVIGKVHRLQLPLRLGEKPQERVVRPARLKPKPTPLLTAWAGPIIQPEPKCLTKATTLRELQNHHCRWPIGDPLEKGFRFCGEPDANLEIGMPYCPEHRKVAYRGRYEVHDHA